VKVLLRDKRTRLFYGAPEHWVRSADEARVFANSIDAIKESSQAALSDVQIVMKFPTEGYDIVIDVAPRPSAPPPP
jgi:hypothetical protein